MSLLTAVVTDLTGREVGRATEPTRPEKGPQYAEERPGELLAGLVDGRRLEGIGLTVPGNRHQRRVGWSGRRRWTGATSRWARQFGPGSASPVYVENDANAAALAEEQLREASEGDNLLFLLLDSGIGAGLLVASRAVPGRGRPRRRVRPHPASRRRRIDRRGRGSNCSAGRPSSSLSVRRRPRTPPGKTCSPQSKPASLGRASPGPLAGHAWLADRGPGLDPRPRRDRLWRTGVGSAAVRHHRPPPVPARQRPRRHHQRLAAVQARPAGRRTRRRRAQPCAPSSPSPRCCSPAAPRAQPGGRLLTLPKSPVARSPWSDVSSRVCLFVQSTS